MLFFAVVVPLVPHPFPFPGRPSYEKLKAVESGPEAIDLVSPFRRTFEIVRPLLLLLLGSGDAR